MKRAAALPTLAFAALIATPIAAVPNTGAPNRITVPFAGELPWILGEGSVEFGVQGGWVTHEDAPFDNLGAGDVARSRATLTGALARGLGERVEGSIAFGWQASVGDQGSHRVQPQDVRLGFGYALDGREDTAVATSLHFTAKVPTAPDRDGAGTDETDLGASISAGARSRRAGVFGTAGFLLLGNPLRNGAQDDVATYGLGGWLGSKERLEVTMEIEGQFLSRFGNSPGYLHLGLRPVFRGTSGRGVVGIISVSRGVNGDSSRWGILAGATWFARNGR